MIIVIIMRPTKFYEHIQRTSDSKDYTNLSTRYLIITTSTMKVIINTINKFQEHI